MVFHLAQLILMKVNVLDSLYERYPKSSFCIIVIVKQAMQTHQAERVSLVESTALRIKSERRLSTQVSLCISKPTTNHHRINTYF